MEERQRRTEGSISFRATALISLPQRVDTSPVSVDNVDRRLLDRFEASREHERARRELLPPEWLNAERPPADHLSDVFEVVLERAREHVRAQKDVQRRQAPRRGQSQA